MSERASFILGRALPLGVFGFLLAIQAELAYSGVVSAVSGALDRADAMYLLNRLLTVSFFAFLLGIYAVRSKAIAHDHNPLAIAVALIGSFILYGIFLIPGQPRRSHEARARSSRERSAADATAASASATAEPIAGHSENAAHATPAASSAA